MDSLEFVGFGREATDTRASTRRLLRPRDGQPLTRDQLYEHARGLADTHSVSISGKGSKRLYRRFADHVANLDAAYAILSEAAGNREFLTPGAEWLLDNYHIIQQQVQDIRKHFPRAYDRTLPKLTAGPLTGFPRVYHLVIEFLLNSDSVVGSEILTAFIHGYQSRTPLTTGEIWAVPIMLRFALLENLALLADRMLMMRSERKSAESLIDDIVGDESQAGTQILLELASKLVARPDFLSTGAPYLLRRLRERGRKASLTVQWLEERLREEGLEPDDVLRAEQYILAADQISIGNSFTSLKTITYIDWKDWFESVSKVHEILLRDPAKTYGISDFHTRDLYRREIELLAKRSNTAEPRVAETTIELAEEAQSQNQEINEGEHSNPESHRQFALKRSHVGHYIIGKGRQALEERLDFTPSALQRLARKIRSNPLPYYLGAIFLLSLGITFHVVGRAWELGAPLATNVTLTFLTLLLASEIAITIVQWFITRVVPPTRLPKLDLRRGIPEACRTAVVVQTIVKDAETYARGVEALEVRYLANTDENLVWGILADLPDADAETTSADTEIFERAQREIEQLRLRHPSGTFFTLFRRRSYNSSQGKYLAWERKRGKVEEFNRLLLNQASGSFILDGFDRTLLDDIRYVITLDDDSQLPRGSVQKLIGTIAHPLNAPIIGQGSNGEVQVLSGYSIIQPRMSTSLMSAHASRFARICAGESGLDPYTHMVSEVYQDLFNDGTFIGKGIYDVRAFAATLDSKFPENALLSHDIIEGNVAGCGVASDIELFDNFPARYHVHARRLHRWIRGDWQFLPWIFSKAPSGNGKTELNTISPLGRWKLIDNLRRSLVPPALFLFFLLTSTSIPGPLAYWAILMLIVIVLPVYLNVAQAFLTPPARSTSLATHMRGVGRDLVLMTERAVILLSILPHQAYLMLHAIAVTLYRMTVSKKNLLEWEPAYLAERRKRTTLLHYVQEFLPALLLTLFAAGLILTFAPQRLIETVPFITLWLCAPYIMKELSEPETISHTEVSPEQREYLKTVAWHTWRYFRDHITAEHNYLIPDNVQLQPNRVVAPRTSPTNISLSVLSAVAAYDNGFATLPFVLERIQRIFGTLGRLERFRGHFLNWYNTRTLDPLLPRYVSMVDSGNLVGHLIASRSVFRDFFSTPIIHAEHLIHVQRILRKIDGILESNRHSGHNAVRSKLRTVLARLDSAPNDALETVELLRLLRSLEDVLPELAEGGASDETILDLNNELHDISLALDLLAGVESYSRFHGSDILDESANEKISAILKTPWLSLNDLEQLANIFNRLAVRPLQRADDLTASEDGAKQLSAIGQIMRETVHYYFEQLNDLIEQSTEIINSVDFGFLYDYDRKLFAIGYDVGNARRDGSYYDLLASEARLGSLVAIALGQIPQEHWFALGRPLADTVGGKALMAWGGTMFEYLMPNLMTRTYPDTILSGTFQAVVRAQQAYGSRRGVPWGVSESAFSGVDFEETYQYHAFGVPGLGLKRGLEEDLVISPYSTFLALPYALTAAMENLRRLEQEGGRGEFGFYEAIDYTPSRLSTNERSHVVQAFFAHHQGMSFVALTNLLHSDVFQDRFHSDQQIRATELLLQEKFPTRISVIVPASANMFPVEQIGGENEVVTAQSVTTPHTQVPVTHLLSNGRYGLMLDNAGSGWSNYEREFSLTRWREDLSQNSYGSYLYIQDLENGHNWSATYQPTLVEPESYEVFFGPDKAEYKRRDFDIFVHSEITVSPEDDVEIRRYTITNLSGDRRLLQLTSYGEVALASTRADQAHPAFSKMFIESEVVPDLDAILFSRRPRSDKDEPMFFLHMATQRVVWARMQHETSRAEFLGRGRSARDPIVLEGGRKLSETTGYVLDPVFSIRTVLELEPGQSETVTFISAASHDRATILDLAWRYREIHHVSRAFEMAWSQASVELRNEQSSARQWLNFQRLGAALLFNIERYRAKPDVIARNRLGQSGLWRFGISGDFPICLVRITEPDQMKLAQEVIHAHHFLRQRGFIFELVILNEYPGGYLQNLQEDLHFAIRSNPSGGMLDKRGGIFLRTSQQLNDEERELLQTVSRVILSGLRGGLANQLRSDDKPLEPVPFQRRIVGSTAPEAVVRRFEAIEESNGYGGFLDDGATYAITVNGTLPPMPWSNIVANSELGFLVTERGSGYTWHGNCRENRLTPWSNDPISDPAGEAIYIRDTSNGTYWCPTPGPVTVEPTYYVEHRFGESVFTAEVEQIQSRLNLGVLPDDPVKYSMLELRNTANASRKLEIYYYVELTLGVSRDDSARYITTQFDKEDSSLSASTYYSAEFPGRRYFVTATQAIEGFTASRQEFLGPNRDLSCPILLDSALKTGAKNRAGTIRLSGRTGAGFDPCAVLRITIELPPQTTARVSFLFGEAPQGEAGTKMIAQSKERLAELYASRERPEPFRSITQPIQVRTPVRTFNYLMNGWLLYQTYSARLNARTGFYQSGGAFGFRDQLQDVLALLPLRPDLVRAQILLHASRQFPEGDVQHWWHPPSGKGVRTRITDDFLWLPLVTARYIEATGDRSILQEVVPYLDGPKLGEHEMEAYIVPSVSEQRGTVFDHCVQAIENGMKFGSRGIPLIGGGDWNDGMNEVGSEGKGESIWLGWFLITVLKRFVPIAIESGRKELADRWNSVIRDVASSIEKHGWDGEWYRRAYFDDGTPLGSSTNTECRIDSIAQTWSIISGEGDSERQRIALESAYQQLVDRKHQLIKLLYPPFDEMVPHPGYIQGYLPGVRENGGQYSHAAAWMVIAYAMSGNAERAVELFQTMNPIEHGNSPEKIEIYKGEPYVLCGDVYAAEPYEGRAGWSWYTGSAGWLYQAGLEHIIGLKIENNGFRVEPCIPGAWPSAELSYRKGASTFIIKIDNPKGVSQGVASFKVNGVETANRWVSFDEHQGSDKVSIVVTLG